MTRGALWAALFLVACGGAKSPPESPAEPPAESGDAPETSGEGEASKPEASGEGEASKPEASGEGASSEDRTKALQVVLDDEELEKYLKLGQPGRFPLKVAGTDIPSGLTKATKPVEIVSEPKSDKDPVLVFTKIEISATEGTATYRYDVEGIKGSARMKKGEYGWELTSSRIVER